MAAVAVEAGPGDGGNVLAGGIPRQGTPTVKVRGAFVFNSNRAAESAFAELL